MHPIYKGMGYDHVIDSLFTVLTEHLNHTNDPFIEKQWKTEQAPFYQYNDAATHGMIPELEKLNIGTKPIPSDHLFSIPDLSPFPFTEKIEFNKSTFFGEINLTFNATLENQPDHSLYVSRFQDRLCITQNQTSGGSDYMHIDEREIFQIIVGETDITNKQSMNKYDINLEAISFRKMLGDEIAIKYNNSENVFISSIETDEDYDYYLDNPLNLIQNDTITIETHHGHWRLNGFIFELVQQDSALTQVPVYYKNNKIHVVPNPCRQKISIYGIEEDDLIKVINLHGEILYSGYQNHLDVSTYKPGLYLVISGLQATKFIKLRLN